MIDRFGGRHSTADRVLAAAGELREERRRRRSKFDPFVEPAMPLGDRHLAGDGDGAATVAVLEDVAAPALPFPADLHDTE